MYALLQTMPSEILLRSKFYCRSEKCFLLDFLIVYGLKNLPYLQFPILGP